MDESLHQRLLQKTERLRRLVGECSTETVVGTCAAYSLERVHSDEKDRSLTSPYKQLSFLLGLMLTTPEPVDPKDFGSHGREKALQLLEEIFQSYTFAYWPKPGDKPSEQWLKSREVAMSAFLHFFYTGLMASAGQISKRIKTHLSPFDEEMRVLVGITATEALQVVDWIANSHQQAFDDLIEAMREEKAARIELLNRAQNEAWDIERLRSEAQQSGHLPKIEKVQVSTQDLMKVRLDSLQKRFGNDIAESYWNLFVSKRGEVQAYTYLTERNIAEEKPLFLIEKGVAMCHVGNTLYHAILTAGERNLLGSTSEYSFLKRRDKVLEKEAEDQFRRIFGASAQYYPESYETSDLQHEHDLIISWKRNLFIIEAKARPPIEPFRDPDKAYLRLMRAFRSDRSIQKAFEQANRIRRKIASGSTIELYDSKRQLLISLRPEDFDQVYCICLTRDDFGPLAVNLSLLLEKDETDPYPWVVNILDLENLIDGWVYFGWGQKEFCDYLDSRIKLHGKVFGSDELEFAGYFIQHGGLDKLTEFESSYIHLAADYSDVFDEIYKTTKYGGDPVVYSPTEPFITDVREALAEAMDMDPPLKSEKMKPVRIKKQGRNEPCGCGSGRKFKHCCGRNT